jgi:hypothetical protein
MQSSVATVGAAYATGGGGGGGGMCPSLAHKGECPGMSSLPFLLKVARHMSGCGC